MKLQAKKKKENEDARKIAEKLRSIFAKYLASDCITRMVRLNLKVQIYFRRPSEYIKEFIIRFKALDLGYRNLTKTGKESSNGHIFAIRLLMKDELPAHIFGNIVGELINKTIETKIMPKTHVSLSVVALEELGRDDRITAFCLVGS